MEDEKLIECVRKYEFLYNLQHPKYMDSVKKERAWKDISSQLKQPPVACKQRWQGLRDAYRRASNKKKGKSGQAKKIKKWKYEDEMSFVAPFLLERKTLDSTKLTSDDDLDNDNETREIEHDTMENPNTDNIDDDTTAVDFVESKNATGTVIQKEVENDVQRNKPQYNQTKKAKAIKRVKTQTAQSASAVSMTNLLDEPKKPEPQREHELDRFFLNISDTVKKFPPYLQALTKNKIFSLVSEVELQLLTPPSLRSSSQYSFSNAYSSSPQSISSILSTVTPTPTSPDDWDERS